VGWDIRFYLPATFQYSHVPPLRYLAGEKAGRPKKRELFWLRRADGLLAARLNRQLAKRS
jgi:hypothetical protein